MAVVPEYVTADRVLARLARTQRMSVARMLADAPDWAADAAAGALTANNRLHRALNWKYEPALLLADPGFTDLAERLATWLARAEAESAEGSDPDTRAELDRLDKEVKAFELVGADLRRADNGVTSWGTQDTAGDTFTRDMGN